MELVLLVLGVVAAVLGVVQLVFAAFRESFLWGLGVLVVPFLFLLFVILDWKAAKSGFLWIVSSVILLGIAVLMRDGGPILPQ